MALGAESWLARPKCRAVSVQVETETGKMTMVRYYEGMLSVADESSQLSSI